MAVLIAALIVALSIAALLAWFCYRLLVDRGHLLLRLDDGETADSHVIRRTRGLPDGGYLADFALPVLSGSEAGVVALSDLAGRPLVLVFLRADCLFSRAFAWQLASQPPGAEAPLTVAVLVGDADSPAAWGPFSGLPGLVLLDTHGQVARLMRVTVTPSGYLVDAARHTVGRLLAGPAALLAAAHGKTPPSSRGRPGGENVTESVEAAQAVSPLPRGASTARNPLPVGSVAPDFTLPTIDGNEWSLATHRGAPLTLLFSDPSCPPCAALLTELGSQAGAGMVIISQGDAGENRQLAAMAGIAAPILLQRGREVARAYRTLETPAAFHIDERGEIAAGPAIGREAVRALLVEIGSGTMR